ncbi:hypothetical protein ACQR1W_14060 [Bradyrhizobium sp. HKCCYLS1011]|uniref:hypothetical protein n=1 Tax=Bradyrhizobium sp. HKCCYLS1011 TaxID=3420733 RepID=UPI003EC03441
MLILALVVAGIFRAQAALAQGTFPAPLPGQTGDSALPSGNGPGAAPIDHLTSPFSGATGPVGSSESCRTEFFPLREEAERRGKLIKAASDRHAPPDEVCRLIGAFEDAEAKMIKYLEAHAQACSISVRVVDQLKGGHETTQHLLQKVCDAAKRMRSAGPDVLGPAPTAPTRVWPPKEPMGDFEIIK